MIRNMTWFLATVLIFSSVVVAQVAEPAVEPTQESSVAGTRMTPELLWKLGRFGEAKLSPDGSHVAYTVRRYRLEANKGWSTLYLMDVVTQEQRVLVEDWSSLGSVQWVQRPEGLRIFFEGMPGKAPGEGEDEGAESDDDSNAMRPQVDSPQAWSLDPESGNLIQVTNLEDGIANLKVAPTADRIAVTLDVKLDPTVNEIYPDLPHANARIIDSLMYRHWNQWHDYKYSHLHVAPLDADCRAGQMRDLMEGIKADCPVPPFGGSEQFNWSPDGKEIAYTLKDVPNWAESTNSDVFVVKVDGEPQPILMSPGMPGYDNDPVYSPDGKYLAFHSMERAGFESDRNRIMVVDRASGRMVEVTRGLDQTAHSATWTPDSKALIFRSEYRGTDQLFRVSVDSPRATQITRGRKNWGLLDLFPDGNRALVSFMDMIRPTEMAVLNMENAVTGTLTHINDDVYENLELPTIKERWVEATDGKRIHCWVIYPPGFEKSNGKKWPMLTYCQGGPQGQIGQWFSYRWNFHLMAANDYVIVAPNRRGLPGFGREWNDQISGDWGGQAMQDILSATDDMMTESYIDPDRVGAIGASFGGYTVYWMMGNHDGRFCSMVSHCGVFNLESMYGSTEELFFVNWDLGGPYWKSPEIKAKYEKFSPHRYVQNWKTPLLVIHGEKDFRVPVTQGMEAFTAAQVQGVDSRFLYFPEEGHWVMGPQNGVLWHRVFFDWLDRYCKPEKASK